MTDFTPKQIEHLLSHLNRIAKSLEDLTYISKTVTINQGVSIHNSSLEEINEKLEDLGYLHGIAKQIDGLKEKNKFYRTPSEY